jgi:hypothetical protein
MLKQSSKCGRKSQANFEAVIGDFVCMFTVKPNNQTSILSSANKRRLIDK